MSFEFGAFAAGLAAWAGSREGRRKTGDLVGDHAARGVGAAVRRPGGHAVLGAARVPGRGRGDLRADRAAGDLGRPAAVAGVRRRGLRHRGDRARVHRRGVLPRAVHRAAGGHRRVRCSSRSASARHWASRRRPARTRCSRRTPAYRRSTRASTTTSRRTSRSCRSCSWPGSRSRCSACSAWRRGCASSGCGGGRAALRAALAGGDGWLRPRGRGSSGRVRRGGVRGRVLAGRDRAAGRGDRRVADPGAALGGQRPAGCLYTPDCTSGSGFQVCVHPAFGFYLHQVAAELDPVAAEIAGPARRAGRRAEVASQVGGQEVTERHLREPAGVRVHRRARGRHTSACSSAFDPAGLASGIPAGAARRVPRGAGRTGPSAAGITVPPRSTRRSRRWRTCCWPGSARRRSARRPATRRRTAS